MEKAHLTAEERRALIYGYAGKTVRIEIDRPVGTRHEKNGNAWEYPINYGYIPGVLGGDGEELDVYLLGVEEPLAHAEVEVVGAVWRADDVEDKLISVLKGAVRPTLAEATAAVSFQEQYHKSSVEIFDA